MRDTIARQILFVIGVIAIGAGLLGLLGVIRLESRMSSLLVGVGAIAGGISMVLRSRGPNPPIGGR
ncbi:MAG TPA: hypothetical protein VFZ04_19240 [Longimicrobiales bacterium]